MNLPSQVLNSLVDRRLLRAEAERLGLSVSDAEVTARILKMRDQQGNLLFVKDGAFVGEAIYRRMLAGANLSPEGFEADTREQALMEKLNRFVTESSFVGEDELKADFEGRTVKAKIAYALVPAPALSPESIPDAEAEAHFKKSPADYQLPERRKGKYEMNQLWYTPILPLLFYFSAIAVGLGMTIFEATLSSKAFGHEIKIDVLAGLAKALPYVLGFYFLVKLGSDRFRR